VQMVTFRLADSFPRQLLLSWEDELRRLTEQEADIERYRRIKAYLDKGVGTAWLHKPAIAHLVQQSLFHFDGDRYRLNAWVIMPNHVHVLLTLSDRYGLSSVVHSWKSYTASEANRLLARKGDFWHREYFDRYVRDERHYATVVRYIEANPVRAGLCANIEHWSFSSAARLS